MFSKYSESPSQLTWLSPSAITSCLREGNFMECSWWNAGRWRKSVYLSAAIGLWHMRTTGCSAHPVSVERNVLKAIHTPRSEGKFSCQALPFIHFLDPLNENVCLYLSFLSLHKTLIMECTNSDISHQVLIAAHYYSIIISIVLAYPQLDKTPYYALEQTYANFTTLLLQLAPK